MILSARAEQRLDEDNRREFDDGFDVLHYSSGNNQSIIRTMNIDMTDMDTPPNEWAIPTNLLFLKSTLAPSSGPAERK